MTAQFQKVLFLLDDFHKMLSNGILPKNEMLELIEGEIFTKTVTDVDKAVTLEVAEILARQFDGQAIIQTFHSLRLNDYYQLIPFITVLKPRADFYEKQIPNAADAYFVVELTLEKENYDVSVNPRSRHFSHPHFPEVWFINPVAGFIELCTKPNFGYSHIQTLRRGRTAISEAAPNLQIEVDKIFQ